MMPSGLRMMTASWVRLMMARELPGLESQAATVVLEMRRSGGCSKRRGKVGRADEGADDLRERTALERWLFAAERAETFFAARGGVRRAEARRRRGRLRFFIEALVETKSPNVQCSKRSVGRNARIAANAIAGGGECQRGIQRSAGEDARRVS